MSESAWWITTGLDHGGKKKLGPFVSQDLALKVRAYVEAVENRSDLWVEQVPAVPFGGDRGCRA